MKAADVLRGSVCLASIVTCVVSILFLETPHQLVSACGLGSDAAPNSSATSLIDSCTLAPKSKSLQRQETATGDQPAARDAQIARRETLTSLNNLFSQERADASWEGMSNGPSKHEHGHDRRFTAPTVFFPGGVLSSTTLSKASAVEATRTSLLTFSVPERANEPTTQNVSNPALIPAVLVPPDVNVPLTGLQSTGRQKIEDDFVEQIGGAQQNPSDPDYRARWQSAQEMSDAMFRQKFGTVAFLRNNTEAGRQRNGQ